MLRLQQSANSQGRGAGAGRALGLGMTRTATVDPTLRNTPPPAVSAKANPPGAIPPISTAQTFPPGGSNSLLTSLHWSASFIDRNTRACKIMECVPGEDVIVATINGQRRNVGRCQACVGKRPTVAIVCRSANSAAKICPCKNVALGLVASARTSVWIMS